MPPMTGWAAVAFDVLAIRQAVPPQLCQIVDIRVEVRFRDLALLLRQAQITRFPECSHPPQCSIAAAVRVAGTFKQELG